MVLTVLTRATQISLFTFYAYLWIVIYPLHIVIVSIRNIFLLLLTWTYPCPFGSRCFVPTSKGRNNKIPINVNKSQVKLGANIIRTHFVFQSWSTKQQLLWKIGLTPNFFFFFSRVPFIQPWACSGGSWKVYSALHIFRRNEKEYNVLDIIIFRYIKTAAKTKGLGWKIYFIED